MGKIFCVEFQRYHLKFHTKYLFHTVKNVICIQCLGALKFLLLSKLHIFQCMGKIFCVEFQRYHFKFHTKYLSHTLKNVICIQCWKFTFVQHTWVKRCRYHLQLSTCLSLCVFVCLSVQNMQLVSVIFYHFPYIFYRYLRAICQWKTLQV